MLYRMMTYSTSKMEFPEVDLPVDMIAWTDVNDEILNLYRQSCRLEACIFALCLEGNLKASINLHDVEVGPNELITLFPGTIIQFYEHTENVKIAFIAYSSHCIHYNNGLKQGAEAFSFPFSIPTVRLDELTSSYLHDYIALYARITTGPKTLPIDLAQASLQNMLLTVNHIYSTISASQTHRFSKQQQLCNRFFKLVIDHFATHRQSSFYAEQLGVTPQYLSTVVKEVTGKNVLDIIAHVVIMDARRKLRSTQMTIQEIGYSLGFPNPSFFGKYFKRYTDTTPQKYRNGE